MADVDDLNAQLHALILSGEDAALDGIAIGSGAFPYHW